MSLIENEVYDLVGIIKGKNQSDEPTFDEGHLSDKLMLKLELTLPLSAVRQRLVALQEQILAMPAYRSAQMYYDVD